MNGLTDWAVTGAAPRVVGVAPVRPPLVQIPSHLIDRAYPELVQAYVTRELKRRRAYQERIDRNTAMVLWGIHL